jgi:alcohol dehydrogenase (NADP+)
VFTYNDQYGDGGVAYGGYAEKVRLHESFAFPLPDGLPSDVVAPLLCAGATVFSPLRRFNAGPGKQVGVVGIGMFYTINYID